MAACGRRSVGDLSGPVVGSSLTAAGLAGRVLAKNHLVQEADETRELQDGLNAALRPAATLLDSWSEPVGDDDEADRQAARLRSRVRSLRQALEAE